MTTTAVAIPFAADSAFPAAAQVIPQHAGLK
jgi:hypothetical protein